MKTAHHLLFFLSGVFWFGAIEIQAQSQYRLDSIYIYRDGWGVPHIYAPTDAEVAYGLAWAHAEDDFEHIQETLLSGRGILAEAKGKDAALLDFFVRFFDVPQRVNEQWKQQISPEFQKVLQGYCAGLNAYAQTHKSELLLRRALPFKPQDALGGYMLSFLLFAGTAGDLSALLSGMLPVPFQLPEGSNAFALSKNRSNDESTWLVLNPHNNYSGSYSWYEAHTFSAEGSNFYGALFPGGVGLFHGFNQSLAWAHTFNYHDLVDVYKLETDAAENAYKVNGKWFPLLSKDIQIMVKVGPLRVRVRRTMYKTMFGPALKGPQGIFAIRNAALGSLASPEQWWQMTRAGDLESFENALKTDAFPMLHIMYADKEGNIMLRSQTHLPERKPGMDWSGVVLGSDSTLIWKEKIPYPLRPKTLNPDSGFLFNANNQAYSCTCFGLVAMPNWTQKYPGLQSIETNRSYRIQELLVGLGCPKNIRDIRQMKYDRQYPKEGYIWDGFQMHLALAKPVPPELLDIWQILRDWNGSAGIQNVGAAHFVEFAKRLSSIARIPLSNLYLRKNPPKVAEIHLALSQTKDWFIEHFDSLKVPLGRTQYIGRGGQVYPKSGIKETLAPTETMRRKNGFFKADGGDSFIMEVEFPKGKRVRARAVQAYGNSNRPNSPHFNDQTPLFVQDSLREVVFHIPLPVWRSQGYHPGPSFKNDKASIR